MPCAASTSRIAPSHAARLRRHLVGEVDVPGGVDEVQDVRHAVAGGVGQADGLALDRDAALALDVHPVEVLRAHRAAVDDAGDLQHAVGQGRLAVVDVGDDAEVPDHRRVGGSGLRGVSWWPRRSGRPRVRSGDVGGRSGGRGRIERVRAVRPASSSHEPRRTPDLRRTRAPRAGSRAGAGRDLAPEPPAGYPGVSRGALSARVPDTHRPGPIRYDDAKATGTPVANIKSQIKRNRTNEAARLRNKSVKSALKTSGAQVPRGRRRRRRRRCRRAGQDRHPRARQGRRKGVIHKNQAANRKSAIATRAAELQQTA